MGLGSEEGVRVRVRVRERDHLPAVVGVLREAPVRHEAVLRVALLTLDDGLRRGRDGARVGVGVRVGARGRLRVRVGFVSGLGLGLGLGRERAEGEGLVDDQVASVGVPQPEQRGQVRQRAVARVDALDEQEEAVALVRRQHEVGRRLLAQLLLERGIVLVREGTG